jgi:hypothetical protein
VLNWNQLHTTKVSTSHLIELCYELTDTIQTMTTYVRNDSDASSGGSTGRKKEAGNAIELVPTQSQAQPSGPLKLTEANSVEKTGYEFTTRKKWLILTVVGLCQTSMSK